MSKKSKDTTESEVERQEVQITTEKVTKEDKDLAVKTLVGDVRDKLLIEVKAMTQGWNKTPEAGQKAIIESITKLAEDTIRKGINVIASKGRTTIIAMVDNVAIKDKVKVTLTTRKTPESINALGCIQGMECLIVPTGEKEFMGHGDVPKPDPDQPNLAGLNTGGVGESAGKAA